MENGGRSIRISINTKIRAAELRILMNYGRYQIVRELGRGSMGVVYQAHDPQIDRLVALKVLRQDRIESQAFVKRFLKEARAIGRLSHPSIVTVYDAGEDQGNIFIAMEFLEGRPLNEVIKERRFKLEEILHLAIQVAEALSYAHEKGVVHRDIKPSNIVLQPKGFVKITDFGIAHFDDPSATMKTQAGEILGTPAYMSPEQILGKPVDGRSDIFSLGVILYELSTGKRPFGREGKTLATILHEIVHNEPPLPIEENPEIQEGLSHVVVKCLSKAPEDRFQTGEALAESLRECQREDHVETLKTPHPVARKPKYPFLLVFLLLIIAGAGGFYYAFQQGFFLQKESKEVVDTTIDTAPKTASLRVISKPAEAEVFVDGISRGKSPVGLDLPLGNHLIRVTLPGYEDWADQILLDQPRPYPMSVEMKQKAILTTLQIQTTPAGGEVFVDETARGKAPLGLDLPVGTHKIRLALPGYEDWTGEVRLKEGRPYPLDVALKPNITLALVQVESTPAGARIFVDGVPEGATPTGIEVPLGMHTISLVLQGFEDWEDRVQLTESKEYPLKVEMKPLAKQASLKLDSAPVGATVQVDGIAKGRTPLTLDLSLGRHSIRMSVQGFRDWEDTIQLEEARVYPLKADLKPVVLKGSLKIDSSPSGSDVVVDGNPQGKTPIRLDLPLGSHTVRLMLQGYHDWEEKIQLNEQKEFPIKAELQPMVKEAFLRVESKPQGALVYVDGTSKGKTPLNLKTSLGKHLVQVSLAEHETWEKSIQVSEAREYPVRALLKPISKDAVLNLASDPPKASVYVDGIAKGKTPLKVKVPLGKHNIRMTLQNHQDWERQVQIQEVQEYPLSARLTPSAKPDEWGIGEWRSRDVTRP